MVILSTYLWFSLYRTALWSLESNPRVGIREVTDNICPLIQNLSPRESPRQCSNLFGEE